MPVFISAGEIGFTNRFFPHQSQNRQNVREKPNNLGPIRKAILNILVFLKRTAEKVFYLVFVF
jgi:hypothetical protein